MKKSISTHLSSALVKIKQAKNIGNDMRKPLMIFGPAILIIAALILYLFGGRYESTDDAYVQNARVAISSDVAGRVKEILVHDNQEVQTGEALFRLDDAPFQIAVNEALAQLASARQKVEMLKANYRQKQADLVAAESNFQFQKSEYNRQSRLATSGIASQSQLDQALHNFNDAKAQQGVVKQQIVAVIANLSGNPDIALENHPDVQQAQAFLDRAKLNLSYTVIKAPSDGIVTRVEELQVGNFINAAVPVFALISTHDVWVEANFKEDQLAHIRPGQKALVEIDGYSGKSMDAIVSSLSPITGSQLSILPPENATGNWVKVVQRLPIRIRLTTPDPALALRGGLSANVTIDTGHSRIVSGFQ